MERLGGLFPFWEGLGISPDNIIRIPISAEESTISLLTSRVSLEICEVCLRLITFCRFFNKLFFYSNKRGLSPYI